MKKIIFIVFALFLLSFNTKGQQQWGNIGERLIISYINEVNTSISLWRDSVNIHIDSVYNAIISARDSVASAVEIKGELLNTNINNTRDSLDTHIDASAETISDNISIATSLLSAIIQANRIGKIYEFTIKDTLGNSTGERNQYAVDTFKVDLSDSLGIDGIYTVMVKIDTIANSQGKPPAVAIGHGFYDTETGEVVLPQDSTTACFFMDEDSVKVLGQFIIIHIDEKLSKGITILSKYNDADTTGTLNTRKVEKTTKFLAR